uniref:CUE domain-containing protein n=1 Tax=Eucampia antarctica TaxID=49252 RepID=A0A7S2SM65_9STRA|mmetsp:Transcript_9822/g.9486  ORF Transcript_9822/g.9486 Transcript_9822/m.9486 type:complete len:283 (+) Transcript_9822:70-918(+)|eukprot:CAMPEP_0197827022 /NCGR_PEP_ID=MMETSP1437-20131217/3902_1 /TAXON_ID=49252 ORGANISM="Eucampia antarctica, Strain CCMP1452" /NCGR_SAMPLE_ID=MMETSP1437 /ASSEMBLY_ACC=CAM_ASM_001096 /LENGTH=282 /DNA_ID=CAMNT_0043427721 /DNA_START=38 /DNA_END=886 /DNA_ORIENTATION=+
MSITYEEALQTLNSMFGLPWTEESLDQVLRHHEGHMENTVESVLSHGNGDPQALLNKLNYVGSEGGEGNQQSAEQISMDEEIARRMMQDDVSSSAIPPGLRRTAAAAPSSNNNAIIEDEVKGHGTQTHLPPDFLRIPGQVDEDEALARMLQDEMFAKEVKKNPEFANNARLFNNATGRITSTTATARGNTANQGPRIIDAISDMGETAKTRLAMLANRFNQNKNKIPATTGGAGGSSGISERRGLLNNNNDLGEEEVSFMGQPGTNDDFELAEWDNNNTRRH